MSEKTPRLPADDQLFFRKAAFFKLLLFLSVIYNHALNYDIYPLHDYGTGGEVLYGIEKLMLYMSGLSNPMYYWISGFAFFNNYHPSQTLDKWKRRVFTLFIPWILWNTIMWAMGIAMESIPIIASRLNAGFGYELSLHSWFFDALMGSADGPMWFMLNLIVAVLVSPLLYYVLKNKYVGLAAIAGAMAVVHFADVGRYSPFMTGIYYAEAAWMCMHAKDIVLINYTKKERIIAAAIVVLYFVLGGRPSVQDGGLRHVICFSIVSPAMWVMVGNAKLSKKVKAFDKHRFWVYSAHFLPLECVEKLWLILAGYSLWAAWLDFFLAPVVISIILIGVSLALKKICYPLWCLLNGKKPARAPAE